MSWVAPVSDGGSTVSGYVVTAGHGGRSCTTGGALTCEVTGLVNGTGYAFTVVASNVAGAGAGSDPSLVVAPRTVPGRHRGWRLRLGIGRPVSCSRRRRLMVVRRWATMNTPPITRQLDRSGAGGNVFAGGGRRVE